MLSLIIPSYGGGVNLERTIASCRPQCDEVVIISTAFFEEDKAHFRSVADKVVELPWNFTFLHGHGSLHNQATQVAKNDWLLLLGVSETVAEWYQKPETALKAASNTVYRCDHHKDINTWKRVWNQQGGTMWSGIMHEEIAMGHDGGLLFRMQDTHKTPSGDQFRDEARKWIKGLSYNWLYLQLLRNPERLGAASPGWLKFVNGSSGAINKFCEEHGQMMEACINGDLKRFLWLVARAEPGAYAGAYGVNFEPQGYEAWVYEELLKPKP